MDQYDGIMAQMSTSGSNIQIQETPSKNVVSKFNTLDGSWNSVRSNDGYTYSLLGYGRTELLYTAPGMTPTGVRNYLLVDGLDLMAIGGCNYVENEIPKSFLSAEVFNHNWVDNWESNNGELDGINGSET
jgi:hypothetical protein